jgi:hypothetical protein
MPFHQSTIGMCIDQRYQKMADRLHLPGEIFDFFRLSHDHCFLRLNGNSSFRGVLGFLGAISCLMHKALSNRSLALKIGGSRRLSWMREEGGWPEAKAANGK